MSSVKNIKISQKAIGRAMAPRKSAPVARVCPSPFALLVEAATAQASTKTSNNASGQNARKRKADDENPAPAKRVQQDSPALAALKQETKDHAKNLTMVPKIIIDPLQGVVLPEAMLPKYTCSAFLGSKPEVDDSKARIWATPENIQKHNRSKLHKCQRKPITSKPSPRKPVHSKPAPAIDNSRVSKDKEAEARRVQHASALKPINSLMSDWRLMLRRLQKKGDKKSADRLTWKMGCLQRIRGAIDTAQGSVPLDKDISDYDKALQDCWNEERKSLRTRMRKEDGRFVLLVERDGKYVKV